MDARAAAQRLLEPSGLILDGPNAWDPRVHNPAMYARVLRSGSLALGESYMDGWWDADALDECTCRAMSVDLIASLVTPKDALRRLWYHLINAQSRSRAFQVGEHYDIGNDLYEAMLDKRLVYSCGYWSGIPAARTLEEAQEAKLNLICRKLGLKGGESILDIGSGWGSFAIFAAAQYGARVHGITISKEQLAYSQFHAGFLPVTFSLMDYRDLPAEQYDHVVSIGMFEHVGGKNYRTFMETVARVLKPGGLFVLHSIGSNTTPQAADPWYDRYIFPNGILPSIAHIGTAIEGLFVMEDWHNFGADYDKTLMAWFRNFDAAWPRLQTTYDDRFYRMWKYYLLGMAGTFRARYNQLWQIVLSKKGIQGGYGSVR